MKLLFPEISVNDTPISHEAIAMEAQNHSVEGFKPGEAWQRAARALVIRELLLEEAKARGIQAECALDGDQAETDNEALIRALVEESLDETLYDETALEAAYRARKDSLRSPALYSVSHILFEARDDAKARAQAALADVLNAPSRFEALAKAHSNCPSRENAGSLGQMMARDFVPEIRPILSQLKLGAVHPELAPSRFGWHILRLDQKREGEVLPRDFAKALLRERLEKHAWVSSSRALVQALVDEAEIVGISMAGV